MIGLVLAAGKGRRLRPYTDGLPKALAPLQVDGEPEHTPLDVILANFAEVGLRRVVVAVGHAADQVASRKSALEDRYGLELELVHNDHAEDWNNCYSLWCLREAFGEGCLLSNGDTVHPVSVEHTLRAAPAGPGVVLAVDAEKALGEEEMKVAWSAGTGLTRITKHLAPTQAYGEYIGVARIAPEIAGRLADVLENTWRRDPSLYYEDGFQALADSHPNSVGVTPIGEVSWAEIDDAADLDRARSICREYACRF